MKDKQYDRVFSVVVPVGLMYCE